MNQDNLFNLLMGIVSLVINILPTLASILLFVYITKYISNKRKESVSDNITNDNKNNMVYGEKTKLYKFFIVFSILICIFIFPFVSMLTNSTRSISN